MFSARRRSPRSTDLVTTDWPQRDIVSKDLYPPRDMNLVPDYTMNQLSRFLDAYDLGMPTGMANVLPVAGIVMDLHETEKAFIMHAELPGVDKDAIKVSIANGMLTVSAERKGEESYDTEFYSYRERHHGKYSRSVTLPFNSDDENITSTFKNGVLELNIPKSTHEKFLIKNIEVK